MKFDLDDTLTPAVVACARLDGVTTDEFVAIAVADHLAARRETVLAAASALGALFPDSSAAGGPPAPAVEGTSSRQGEELGPAAEGTTGDGMPSAENDGPSEQEVIDVSGPVTPAIQSGEGEATDGGAASSPSPDLACGFDGCGYVAKTPNGLGPHRARKHGLRGRSKPRVKGGDHGCELCGRGFATAQALGSHRWRTHGIRGGSNGAAGAATPATSTADPDPDGGPFEEPDDVRSPVDLGPPVAMASCGLCGRPAADGRYQVDELGTVCRSCWRDVA